MGYVETSFSSRRYSRDKLVDFFKKTGIRVKRKKSGQIKTVWGDGKHHFWIADSYDIQRVKQYASGYATGLYEFRDVPREPGYYPDEGVLVTEEGEGVSVAPSEVDYYNPNTSTLFKGGEGMSAAEPHQTQQTTSPFFVVTQQQTQAYAPLPMDPRVAQTYTTQETLPYVPESQAVVTKTKYQQEVIMEGSETPTWMRQRWEQTGYSPKEGDDAFKQFGFGVIHSPAAVLETPSFLKSLLIRPGETVSQIPGQLSTPYGLGQAAGSVVFLKPVGSLATKAWNLRTGAKPTYQVTAVVGAEMETSFFGKLSGRSITPTEGAKIYYKAGDMRITDFSPKDLISPKPLSTGQLSFFEGAKVFTLRKEILKPKTIKYKTKTKPEIPKSVSFKHIGSGVKDVYASRGREGARVLIRSDFFKTFQDRIQRTSILKHRKYKPGSNILDDLYPKESKSSPKPLARPTRSPRTQMEFKFKEKTTKKQTGDPVPLEFETVFTGKMPSFLSASEGLSATLNKDFSMLETGIKIRNTGVMGLDMLKEQRIITDVKPMQTSKQSPMFETTSIIKMDLKQLPKMDFDIMPKMDFDIPLPATFGRATAPAFKFFPSDFSKEFKIKKFRQPNFKRGYSYKTSLTGIVTGFKAKKAPSTITGFGIRPVVIK